MVPARSSPSPRAIRSAGRDSLQAGALQGWIDREFAAALPAAIRRDPLRLFDLAGARLVRDDRNRTARVEVAGRVVWVKQFRPPFAWIRYRFRTDKASRAWLAADALNACGIASPRPLLALHGALGRQRGQGLVVLEDIPDSDSLKSLWPGLATDDRSRLLEQLGRIAAELHRHGLRHRDLNSANVMVTRGKDDGFGIHLIDVNRMRRYRALDDDARLRDLVRLPMIEEDPQRFFAAYAGAPAGGRLAAAYLRRQATARRLQQLPPPLGRLARKLWYYYNEIKGLHRPLPLLPGGQP